MTLCVRTPRKRGGAGAIIPLPCERVGHLTMPSEAQRILELIDWDFANVCMVGYASKRLEEMRSESME
jgi:hypothetical protein